MKCQYLAVHRVVCRGLLWLFLLGNGLIGCTHVIGFNQQTKDNLVSGIKPVQFSPDTPTVKELTLLPAPKGKITAAVYSFKDQTGQYKATATGSSFSTAVSQGASLILLQALKSSGWFIPLEREGLQNLLTERKIIRAAQSDQSQPLQPLKTAQILFEGGIVGYNTNVKTGGLGAAYFGIDVSEKYREDQITVSLRATDVRSGMVLVSTSTTKSVYSREISSGFFRFVSFKKLAEAEGGYTTNEPVYIATRQAIEKALSGLILQGIVDNIWGIEDPDGLRHPSIQRYMRERSIATFSS